MTGSDVLVVGGTHGNELNAAWLIDQWRLTGAHCSWGYLDTVGWWLRCGVALG